MKKILALMVSFILILSLTGCGKGEIQKVSSTQDSPIVGTWKYYKDIPGSPTYKTWTLNFNKGDTYTTQGDTQKNSSSSHADTWGKSGTYRIEGNRIYLSWVNDKGKTKDYDSDFEIKEENGEKQLIFKDNSGDVSIATIGYEGEKFYIIFVKQE